jgi:hypothetical protein
MFVADLVTCHMPKDPEIPRDPEVWAKSSVNPAHAVRAAELSFYGSYETCMRHVDSCWCYQYYLWIPVKDIACDACAEFKHSLTWKNAAPRRTHETSYLGPKDDLRVPLPIWFIEINQNNGFIMFHHNSNHN